LAQILITGDEKYCAFTLADLTAMNECLNFEKTAWLTDHSFEAGAEASGVTNGGETAGRLEKNGGAEGSALFFVTICIPEA
jgi:hypothetical protein